MRYLLVAVLLVAAPAGLLGAAEDSASGFGEISIPDPVKPVNAERCVEPVDVMRRDHMKFLDHQRDETVINGERDSRHSLVGCIDCHNPAREDGEAVRYGDPEHFCTECHAYASVSIDCFECHADRGLQKVGQGRLGDGLTAATLQYRLGVSE